MQEQGDRAADDMTLSAFIDNELAAADAERVRARLATDASFAHRFSTMFRATAAIRGAYRDWVEVIGAVAAVHARALQNAYRGASGGRAAASTERPRLRNVDVAVARLTSEQRSALCLAVLEHLSYVEIAAALQVRDSTVKTRLAEARAALAAKLDETWLAAMLPPSTTRQ
jgi:DNA-directed RNA polymerase specialized sigma24 family protein